MLNKMIGFIARIAVGKQLVSGIAAVHSKLDGSRSEIAMGISALIYVLKIVKIIPEETANTIELSLAPLIGALLADRFKKVKDVVDSVVPAATPETPKP
jgi:hypothetical protein